MMTWITILIVLFALWAVAQFYLSGPKLTHFDSATGEIFDDHEDDAAATQQLMDLLEDVHQQVTASKSLKKGLAIGRDFADNLSQDLESDCEFTAVDVEGVKCEWTIAPESKSNRRVLFLHGGAFIFGSPKGHRIMSHQLAHIAKAAVLSVDYRMLPENKRKLACMDAQATYRWILKNSPDGESPVEKLLVAGDSAGGNLALMLSSWSKRGADRRPDATIGFSPSLDTTLNSPTFKSNAATDPLLGQALGALKKVPNTISLWIGFILMRCNPSDKEVSPLFDDLSELPPTLIHASTTEVLLGDAIRYTNKAAAEGSNVKLQLWKNQVHDWHLFSRNSGSGKQAWSEISKFVEQTL